MGAKQGRRVVSGSVSPLRQGILSQWILLRPEYGHLQQVRLLFSVKISVFRYNNGYNPYSNGRPLYDPYATTARPVYNPYNTATQLYDPYSSSSSSTSKCFGVVCPASQQCDENTGICR